MNHNLAAILPVLAPQAIEWAQRQESKILTSGAALEKENLALARRVGVKHPERIRLSLVPEIPFPTDPSLSDAARRIGLLGPNAVGLTLGYGIYIRSGFNSARVLAHECRHVHQYEQAGSIAEYLPKYLQQVVQYGYADAPYELDARAFEISS